MNEAAGADSAAGQPPGDPLESPKPRGHWLRQGLKLYLVWSVSLGGLLPFFFTLGLRLFPHAPPERFAATGARRVAFPTADGLTLRGIYVPPKAGFPVVVFQHGIRAARFDVAPWARDLGDRGYGVLAFDWRGHGESDGWWIGFGVYEGADLLAADAFLDAQPELVGRDRALIAVSLGAAMIAQHADKLGPEYKCLVLDSPFGDLRRMVDHRLSYFGPLAWLPKQIMLKVSALWMGVAVTTIVPEQKLAAFAPRPLLVFHGASDRTVPFIEGKTLFELYPGPKQSCFTEGDHTEYRVKHWAEWTGRVEAFFRAHMRH